MDLKNLPKPSSYCFGSGPVKKITKWQLLNKDIPNNLKLLGRSHRSKEFINLVKDINNKIKYLLNIPNDYTIVNLTGGATGAMEMALWNFLGLKPIDCLTWEIFGDLWYEDIINYLKLPNVTLHNASFGEYPCLDKVNFTKNDLVFVYSGSTSGVIFKDENKIPVNREGIVISDATSYLFLYNNILWEKLDVVAFSWQKVLAGEAGQGMLILSPRAMERLQQYTPSWPIPKLFRLKDKNNHLIEELFYKGACTNTPSILSFIDVNANLDLIIKDGGLETLVNKVNINYEVIKNWVNKTSWIEFLAKEEDYRSKVISCLIISDEKWKNLTSKLQLEANKFMLEFLESNKVACDICMHRLSPYVGFRIWAGPTVYKEDVIILLKWMEIAYKKMQSKFYS